MSSTPSSVIVPGPAVPAEALKNQSRLRLAATWALIKPYWSSEDRKAGLGLLTLVVALNLGIVYINVLLNEWNRVFYNAIEQRDFVSFKALLLRFSWIAAGFIVLAISRQYYQMMLQMRWRTWMTGTFMQRWLGHQAYYRIEQTHSTDNPDQRLADDLRQFTDGALTLSMGLLNSAVTLVSFIGILWVVSGPITLALGGTDVTIPGYMVWFAIGYAVVGSLIAHFVGRPLIGLSFQQEQYEANFRFMLVRLRENSEPVALYRGEPTEQAGLRARFERIRANWNQLMRYTRRLTFVNSGYGQFAIIFPLLVAAPRYFSGKLTLGGLMQINSAFGQVQGALSWFVDSYSTLVGWKAAANRLIDFQEATKGRAISRWCRPPARPKAISRSAAWRWRCRYAAGWAWTRKASIRAITRGSVRWWRRSRCRSHRASAGWCMARQAAARAYCSARWPASGPMAADVSRCRTGACCSCRSAATCRSARWPTHCRIRTPATATPARRWSPCCARRGWAC
jgi:vitamin B12/bleomycin/antimicrobial peptide transport system ATP-binding/permease protein